MTGPERIRVKDLRAPRLPWTLRVFNAVGGPVANRMSLDQDELLAAARKQTGLGDYGGERFLEPMRVFLDALQEESELSALGRVISRQFVLQLLRSRLRLEELYRQHPEIEDQQITKPIIITGLPRSGTTHLFNLLSQDTSLRWMPYWESLEPFPDPNEPPGRDGRDPRIKRCEKALAMLERAAPHFAAMHEFTVEGPHEEIQLLALDFSTVLLEASYYVPSYGAWYKRTDQTATYAYLKRCLKALQFLRRGERWLLKTPQHLENLQALMTTFPDAFIVQTHRDPVRVTESLATMVAYGARLQQRRPDALAIGRYWSGRAEDMMRASVQDRYILPPEQVIDVHFAEFMQDMTGAVKRVLEFAEKTVTNDTARALDQFLAENPRGKHGLIDYRLEDLELDEDDLRRSLTFYSRRFNVRDEARAR